MKKKFIRFKLAKEDRDLIGWKNSLPTRSFNETVNKILVSESTGQIARIPYEFSSPEVAEETDASFYVDDENVLALLGSIERGKRTDAIKGIIRKHIQYNCENPPEVVSVDLLYNILVDFRTKIEARAATCTGVADKCRKLLSVLFRTLGRIEFNFSCQRLCRRGLYRGSVFQYRQVPVRPA